MTPSKLLTTTLLQVYEAMQNELNGTSVYVSANYYSCDKYRYLDLFSSEGLVIVKIPSGLVSHVIELQYSISTSVQGKTF